LIIPDSIRVRAESRCFPSHVSTKGGAISDTFDVDGNFTIRGTTKPEKLTLTVTGKGTGSGTVVGTMAFDRKDYGMNKGIPFIKIADRVEVTVNLKAKRTSGPPLTFKQ
jgi:polyisoprenoid-binding protein YceI